jgi:hypothetical protein
MLTGSEVACRGFVGGYGVFLDGYGSGGYRVFRMGRVGGCDIGFAEKFMSFFCFAVLFADVLYVGCFQGPGDLFLTTFNDKKEGAWSENVAYG